MADDLPADIALAVRAQAGDRAAADELATITRRAVAKLAAKTAAKYGGGITARDLIDHALSRFHLTLRHYKAARGSFVNYARVAARRAMREYAEREAARQLPSLPSNPAAAADDPEAEAAFAALNTLPPAERLLFAAIVHVGNKPTANYRVGDPTRKPCTPERVAALYGVDAAEIQAVVDRTAAKLRRRLDGGRRPGRPAYPAALMKHIRGLRARKVGWKQVAREVNGLYGVRLSVNAIQVLHHRHRGKVLQN